MKTVRLLIQVPEADQGAAGCLAHQRDHGQRFIRHLLEEYVKQAPAMGQKGR